MPHDELIKLIAPSDERQWAAYHDIRRRVLFEGRGLHGTYDANHPDDRKSGNHPLVLMTGKAFIGVVRVDLSGELAQLRKVAIDEVWQRQGFGRQLLALAEQFAAARRAKRVESVDEWAARVLAEKAAVGRQAATAVTVGSSPAGDVDRSPAGIPTSPMGTDGGDAA